MAQERQVILIDDVDGGEADESVSFALDGVAYDIDLSEGNARRLREALALYIAHARKAGRVPEWGKAAKPPVALAAVREWAKEQGLDVSDRGRIKGDVMEAYLNRNKVVIPERAITGRRAEAAEVEDQAPEEVVFFEGPEAVDLTVPLAAPFSEPATVEGSQERKESAPKKRVVRKPRVRRGISF